MSAAALAAAVHRKRFPTHAMCEPSEHEIDRARMYLEALADMRVLPPGADQ